MDEAVLVSESDLMPAMRHIFQYEGLVIEGGSAAAPAATFNNKLSRLKGRKIAIVISSRNIDPLQFEETVLAKAY